MLVNWPKSTKFVIHHPKLLFMNYSKIGALVKTERKKLQLTQAGLAKLAEVSVKTIKNIETGKKVNLDTIKKVLNLIGYDVKIISLDSFLIVDL